MNTTDTISELRSLSGVAGDVITLLGYYEKGDKPAIIYYFKEGNFIDDGGSIIVPSNPPLNGAWIAIFSNEVFIEDFGVSEANPDNSQSILNAIEMNKKLISKENKKYLINSTLNINGADIDLKLGENTVFYSVPITTSGLEAKKIFNISGSGSVKLKGIFDGGYIVDGVVRGNPTAATISSALIQIENCLNVKLEIQIQNFASNWGTATFDTFMNYGALYVRECGKVECLSSTLTTSRIEGFVFFGNDHVIIDNFRSVNNISSWTPLHCFCNNNVEILNSTINQPSNANGSTINSYNNFTSFSNNFIQGGVGIDFSWESSSIDISPFNINPVKIIVKNNMIKNCSRILTSIHHAGEVKKLYIGVFGNYFENVDRTITQSTGVIRVDACEKLDVYSNIVKTSSEYHGFFQSVGDLDYAGISDNLVSADFFLRLTQADGKKYGIINTNDNIFNALPLNGRSESNTNAFSSFAYVNMVNQPFDLLTSNNNKISAEGRVFWLGGTQSMAKVQLIENSINSSHKVSYLISNVNELKMHRNESFNCDIFASLASLNNSVLDVRENVEHSDVSKNRGMFNSIAGSLKSFTFIENKFDVPNPDTYGIINSVTNITDTLEKNVRDNSPEVLKTKILVSSTKFGTTLGRPTNKVRDYDGYYDIDLNKKIFWDGINWKDSSGSAV